MSAEGRQQYRIAAENPVKLEAVRSLMQQHSGLPRLLLVNIWTNCVYWLRSSVSH